MSEFAVRLAWNINILCCLVKLAQEVCGSVAQVSPIDFFLRDRSTAMKTRGGVETNFDDESYCAQGSKGDCFDTFVESSILSVCF